MRDMNIGLPLVDCCRVKAVKVLVNGLPLWHGAQVTVDTTLVASPPGRCTPATGWFGVGLASASLDSHNAGVKRREKNARCLAMERRDLGPRRPPFLPGGRPPTVSGGWCTRVGRCPAVQACRVML